MSTDTSDLISDIFKKTVFCTHLVFTQGVYIIITAKQKLNKTKEVLIMSKNAVFERTEKKYVIT